MTAHPADDWQQNADVTLMQSQRLERREQPSTEEQYRYDDDDDDDVIYIFI